MITQALSPNKTETKPISVHTPTTNDTDTQQVMQVSYHSLTSLSFKKLVKNDFYKKICSIIKARIFTNAPTSQTDQWVWGLDTIYTHKHIHSYSMPGTFYMQKEVKIS